MMASSGEKEAANALTTQWLALCRLRSEEEVKGLISEMKSLMWRYHAKRYLRRFLPVLLVLALLYGLFQNETVQEVAFTYSRLFLVNFVFPWVNLPKWARVKCLVDNPVFDPSVRPPPKAEECHQCLGMSRPLVIPAENFTARSFHGDFLDGETPVIVRGGSAGWLLEKMTVEHLHEFYLNDEQLKRTLACSLTTDQEISRSNNKLLLRWIMDNKPAHWFAFWEHCSLPQIKAFRPLFRRPPFLPPSISIGGEDMRSWLVLGRQPKSPEPIPLPFKSPLFFLGQVRGQMAVRLDPNPACTSCQPLNFQLTAGDLLLTTEAYELSVLPSGTAFSLALGFSAEA